MTASAAATAVSIVTHAYIYALYNYAFIIARSRSRPGGRHSSIFDGSGWRNVCSIAIIFDGVGGGERGCFFFLHLPLCRRGRASELGWRYDFSFFFYFANKLFLFFLSPSFLSTLREDSNNLMLVRKTSTAFYLPSFTMISFLRRKELLPTEWWLI